MNSTIIIIIALLQFTIICTPLVLQAAALNQDKSPDQRWIIRELCQDCIKQSNPVQVKNQRITPPLELMPHNAKRQQGDLLQELLAPEVIGHVSMQQGGNEGGVQKNSHDSNRQENLFLKEFTAATSIP